jgi:protein-tyrosine phosphatase
MIDTHCHLLFGLDDGPPTLREALDLASRLHAEGVSAVLCTPHYSDLFWTSHVDALERIGRLRPALAESGIPIRVELAAEIGPSAAVRAPLEELLPRSIGGRFLIVEVQPATPLAFFEGVAARLEDAGLTPIFAHPERCQAVWRHPGALATARAAGALVQIVAPSLTGTWGRQAARTAWILLGAGLVDLLGSDAHGRTRPPELADAATRISDRFGQETTVELTEHAPSRVLAALD